MKSVKRKTNQETRNAGMDYRDKRVGQSTPPAAAWFLTSQFAISKNNGGMFRGFTAKEIAKPEILNGVE